MRFPFYNCQDTFLVIYCQPGIMSATLIIYKITPVSSGMKKPPSVQTAAAFRKIRRVPVCLPTPFGQYNFNTPKNAPGTNKGGKKVVKTW